MHFHFFAALAFLLVYRDWRVIVIVAAGAIAVHHLGFMVLQDAGAGVYVMPPTTSASAWSLLHAVFVVFETSVLVVLSRSMETETARSPRGCASPRPPSAPSSPRWPTRSQRRDLSVSGDAGDGAAAILRSGIGQVATLVETIQSAAVDISHTSHEVSAASADSERSSERDRRRRRSSSPPPPSSRPGS